MDKVHNIQPHWGTPLCVCVPFVGLNLALTLAMVLYLCPCLCWYSHCLWLGRGLWMCCFLPLPLSLFWALSRLISLSSMLVSAYAFKPVAAGVNLTVSHACFSLCLCLFLCLRFWFIQLSHQEVSVQLLDIPPLAKRCASCYWINVETTLQGSQE